MIADIDGRRIAVIVDTVAAPLEEAGEGPVVGIIAISNAVDTVAVTIDDIFSEWITVIVDGVIADLRGAGIDQQPCYGVVITVIATAGTINGAVTVRVAHGVRAIAVIVYAVVTDFCGIGIDQRSGAYVVITVIAADEAITVQIELKRSVEVS